MNNLDDILFKLKNCLENDTYEQVETDSFELKDLSNKGKWDQLYESACAFLNTQGGTIIVGIHENLNQSKQPKKYKLTGYDDGDENKLINLSQKFSDSQDKNTKLTLLNLEEFFQWEIRDFLDKRICIIHIRALPEDQKYVCWQRVAYERKISGDYQISEDRINAQLERREELKRARELYPVDNTTIEDLDLDKLNEYIQSLNQPTRIETLKSDLEAAIPFLSRKFFINKEQKPTLLGMLVCGKYIDDFVGGRCQVDAYVEVDSFTELVSNKKIFKNNILKLMDDSYDFCLQNIQIGISYAKGGSKLPEYPLKLIRETINNALAHRDYRSDQFVVINIRPNQSLEIRNPGNFRSQQLITVDQDQIKIRQIIPDPKASNPKLAEILKVYDKWEGRGIGMASLTNACLNNEIDIPYYILRREDINLVIPKGKVYDESSEYWLDSFSGYLKKKCNGKELSIEEKIVLSYFFKTEKLNYLERYTILLTHDNNHFEIIASLEEKGLIFKNPTSPYPYSVYLVDRELTKNDFTSELRTIFGKNYDSLKEDYKEILNVIYHLDEYSNQGFASANLVSNVIYFRTSKEVVDIKKYEYFKRKIRTIFKKLELSQFIVRQNSKKREFYINKDFKESPLLPDILP
jgi:ATP-dependent DNA helicase RecG